MCSSAFSIRASATSRGNPFVSTKKSTTFLVYLDAVLNQWINLPNHIIMALAPQLTDKVRVPAHAMDNDITGASTSSSPSPSSKSAVLRLLPTRPGSAPDAVTMMLQWDFDGQLSAGR